MIYKRVVNLKKADIFVWADNRTRRMVVARPDLLMPLVAVDVHAAGDLKTIEFIGPQKRHNRLVSDDAMACVFDVTDLAHAFDHRVLCIDCEQTFGKHHGMQCAHSTQEDKKWFVPSESGLVKYHGYPLEAPADDFFTSIGL